MNRTAAGAPADALAYVSELKSWHWVTRGDDVRHAAPEDDERFAAWCTCGQGRAPLPPTR